MGKTVFDANKIQERLDFLADKTFKKGDFSYKLNANKLPEPNTYKFLENADGNITIFEMPKPKVPYVVAIDTAGEGSDYYTAHVMDNTNGNQVATLHSLSDATECVWQAHALALMYNSALIAPEINFDGAWTLKAFSMIGYDNLYRRVSKADKTHIKNEDKYGWRTGVDNRQLMINDLIYWCNDNMNCINDAITLNEMLTFTRQEKKLKGIWMGAEPGEHDDLVMCFGILLQAREQQSCDLIPDIKKIEGSWTREELEDAVFEGRIDRLAMEEYKRTIGFYCEEQSQPSERRNRYAR
jgi:hypothetical protein